MQKDYNMSQLTLPIETSILIPDNDLSQHVNDIVESIPDIEFEGFKHHRGATAYHPKMMLKIILYAYTQSVFSGRKIERLLHDSLRMMWLSQRQTPSYKTINRSACPLRNQCMKSNSKANKKIMRNYNWEYFKAQINQKLSKPETQKIYNQRKIDVEPVFRFMKAILVFNRMSVRGINKVKREFGFVLMALNLRKLVASSAAKLMVKGKKSEIFRFLRKPRISSITETILSQTLAHASSCYKV